MERLFEVERDEPWVIPEHKLKGPMVNAFCSSLDPLAYAVGIRGVGARLLHVMANY